MNTISVKSDKFHTSTVYFHALFILYNALFPQVLKLVWGKHSQVPELFLCSKEIFTLLCTTIMSNPTFSTRITQVLSSYAVQ